MRAADIFATPEYPLLDGDPTPLPLGELILGFNRIAEGIETGVRHPKFAEDWGDAGWTTTCLLDWLKDREAMTGVRFNQRENHLIKKLASVELHLGRPAPKVNRYLGANPFWVGCAVLLKSAAVDLERMLRQTSLEAQAYKVIREHGPIRGHLIASMCRGGSLGQANFDGVRRRVMRRLKLFWGVINDHKSGYLLPK